MPASPSAGVCKSMGYFVFFLHCKAFTSHPLVSPFKLFNSPSSDPDANAKPHSRMQLAK